MFKHFDDEGYFKQNTQHSCQKLCHPAVDLIKFPINEPAQGKRKSQIQEYLDWHNDTAGSSTSSHSELMMPLQSIR